MDGGINPDTAGDVLKAGANILVLESAIYKSDNPADVVNKFTIEYLKKLGFQSIAERYALVH